MKKIILISLSLFLLNCNTNNYKLEEEEFIEGKISAIEKGRIGRFGYKPKIYIQNPTRTKRIEIPYEYEDKWKVGDTCILIIKNYIIENE